MDSAEGDDVSRAVDGREQEQALAAFLSLLGVLIWDFFHRG